MTKPASRRRHASGFAIAAALALAPAHAAAEGETTPMIGGAVIGGSDNAIGLVGAELETSWWFWRLGLSGRGSLLWTTDHSGQHVGVVGVSARLLVFDTLVQSIVEPRDIELGVELHAIIERAWWSEQSAATRYGFGVAVRLRGDSEYDLSLLAESRMFLRVMAAGREEDMWIARTASPPRDRDGSDVMIIVGVGAAFGRGDAQYLERFRLRAFSPAAQRLANHWFE
jgi:hypothetical protein